MAGRAAMLVAAQACVAIAPALCGGAAASRPATRPAADLDELLARFARRQTKPPDRLAAAEQALSMGRSAAKRLLLALNGRLKFEQSAYRRDFQLRARRLREAQFVEAAKKAGKTAAQVNADLRTWRKAVLDLHERPGLSKALIARQGRTALDKLNALLYVAPQTVLARTVDLQRRRTYVLKLARLAERCEQLAAGRQAERPKPPAKKGQPNTRRTLEQSVLEHERLACLLAMPMVATARTVLLRNFRAAAQLQPQEAEAIRDFNRIRLLLGQWVVRTDVRLCACARDHCRDMIRLDFVGHDSPLPGKRKPWDRAKRFGTQAGGENITAGTDDPHEANRRWFRSPMHFNNLFHKFRRVGVGNVGLYWTQMLGW